MKKITISRLEKPTPMSGNDRKVVQYEIRKREMIIAQMRASVIRKQITDAYNILENIRFDYLSDTAFRDKITEAKKWLERAYDDFLLDPQYHRRSIENHNKLNAEQFDVLINIGKEDDVCSVKGKQG